MERNLQILDMAQHGYSRGLIAELFELTPQRIQQICLVFGVVFTERNLPRIVRLMKRTIKRENGCWEWQGGSDQHGYGIINLGGGKWSRAHRVSYQAHKGVALTTEQHLMHTCDNPPCINPDHLVIGDAAANAWDREVKLRGGTNRLTPEQVLDIRALFVSGVGNKDIAEKFKVHRSTIERIRNGTKWRWLDEALVKRGTVALYEYALAPKQENV